MMSAESFFDMRKDQRVQSAENFLCCSYTITMFHYINTYLVYVEHLKAGSLLVSGAVVRTTGYGRSPPGNLVPPRFDNYLLTISDRQTILPSSKITGRDTFA